MTDDNVPERARQFAELGALQRAVSRLERELGLRRAVNPTETGKVPSWVMELVDEYGSDLISIHAANGDYAYASPSSKRLFGYAPAELVGESAYVYFHPEDLKRIAEDHAGHEGGEQKVRYRLRCKNGDYRWVETHSRARVSDAGVERIVCITRDVHDEERAKQASRAATLMLAEQQRVAVAGGLMAAFNHEFNNPLLAASLALEQLENDGSSASEPLAEARAALDRMTNVLREMSSIVYRNWSARGRTNLTVAVREISALLPAGVDTRLVESSESTWVPGPEAIVLQCVYHVAYSHVAGIPSDDPEKVLEFGITVEGDFVVLTAESKCQKQPNVMRADLAGIVDGESKGPGLPMGIAERLAERLAGRLGNTRTESGLRTRLALPRVS